MVEGTLGILSADLSLEEWGNQRGGALALSGAANIKSLIVMSFVSAVATRYNKLSTEDLR
jgi:hypothetical protein